MKKYIKKQYVLALTCILLIMNGTVIAVQFLKGYLLDHAVSGSFELLVRLSIFLLLAILLEITITYFNFVYENKVICSAMKQVKSKLFSRIMDLSVTAYYKENSSAFMAKFTNELRILEDKYYLSLTMLLGFGMKVLFVAAALFYLNWILAVITIILLTMPLYVPKLSEKKLMKRQNMSISKNNEFIGFIKDIFEGFEVVKNYSIESIMRRRFNRENDEVMNAYYQNLNTQAEVRTISMFMSYFSYFIVVLISVILVNRGTFSVGDLFIAIGLVEQLSYPIIATAGCIQNILSIQEMTHELVQFMESEETVHEGQVTFSKAITFENVSFAYDHKEKDDLLLKNINLTFNQGKKYLIRGESGKGKTTLMNLLLKYHEHYSGEIRVDDMDLRQISSSLDFSSVSRQDTLIFEDTLRNNISLYKDVEDKDIISVLNMVSLEKFANQDALNRDIGKHGLRLSGGEIKRVTLARALLHRKDLMILDEPFANLDQLTVKRLEQELLNLKDVTLIIISHLVNEGTFHQYDEVVEI